MHDTTNIQRPAMLKDIEAETEAIGFTMASDLLTGSLLRTLAASKPAGSFLELGTGTGMGSSWILAGMDSTSTLITVDSSERTTAVAKRHLGQDRRVTFHAGDGAVFIESWQGPGFDFIFADTYPGKFNHLEETLQLLNKGGLYIIDDLLPQPGWGDGHLPKVANLIATLEQRTDLHITKLNWSTGLIIAVKK